MQIQSTWALYCALTSRWYPLSVRSQVADIADGLKAALLQAISEADVVVTSGGVTSLHCGM